mgnify:CR=1 FL=1
MTAQGVGSTYQWTFHLWSLLYIGGTMTREEYVPNERIVDHSSTGPVWTFTFEPDPGRLDAVVGDGALHQGAALDKLEAAIFSKGDQDLDAILGSFKKAIEA